MKPFFNIHRSAIVFVKEKWFGDTVRGDILRLVVEQKETMSASGDSRPSDLEQQGSCLGQLLAAREFCSLVRGEQGGIVRLRAVGRIPQLCCAALSSL